jgi:hypothetical protein
MAIRRGELRNVVALQRRPQDEVSEVPEQVAASPLYGVAMLKIAMELKKADAKPLDELITGVLSKMRLPEDDFRSFLAANGGLLRTIALRKKY